MALFLGAATDPGHPSCGSTDQPRNFADQPDVATSSSFEQAAARRRLVLRIQRSHWNRRHLGPQRHAHLVGRRQPSATRGVLCTIATRSPASPSTTYISHSGRPRSSGVPAMRPISSSSSGVRRGRHRDAAQVVVEVDVAVLHPHRVVQFERDVDELVAQRRQCVQPRIGHLPEHLEVVAVDSGHVDDADLERCMRISGVSLESIKASTPLSRLTSHPVHQ